MEMKPTAFSIHKWDLKRIAEGRKQVFSGGWITVLDIPPFLRTYKLILSVADLCGGAVEDEDIVGGEELMEEVSFKARGNEDGLVPLLGYLQHDVFFFPIRFVVGRRSAKEEDESNVEKSRKGTKVILELPRTTKLAGQRGVKEKIQKKKKTLITLKQIKEKEKGLVKMDLVKMDLSI